MIRMALSPGSRLGPYEILTPLGVGGMGEVYRAKDPRLGREVVIRVLPASFSADSDRLMRFEHVLHGGAPCVVEEPPRNAGSPTRRCPRLSEVSNRPAMAMKHKWREREEVVRFRGDKRLSNPQLRS